MEQNGEHSSSNGSQRSTLYSHMTSMLYFSGAHHSARVVRTTEL